MRLKTFRERNLNPFFAKGFSLIELLVVMLIVVMMASFSIRSMKKSIERTKEKLGGAKKMYSIFEKARTEARLKHSFIWVEIEKLQGQPERYRFTTWRSPDLSDGRHIDDGGFVIPREKHDTEVWHLRKLGRPKVFEPRAFVVFSPKGVCFAPPLEEIHYGPLRVAPTVAPPGVRYGSQTLPIPRAVSISVTRGKGAAETTDHLRISGSTSLPSVQQLSLRDEFGFNEK